MMSKSVLRAVFIAAALCLGLFTQAAAQPKPTIVPHAPTMPIPVAPSSEVSRPSPTAAAVPSVQDRRPRIHAAICGNPKIRCQTEITFNPWDLPFRASPNAVILDTELFYAVILKSISAPDDNCDIFISEDDRLAAQVLFPDRKVFASRCAEPDALFYTNTKPNFRIMAVYAGRTLAEANRTLAAVKAAGKFPGANLRRMRTGFNGT